VSVGEPAAGVLSVEAHELKDCPPDALVKGLQGADPSWVGASRRSQKIGRARTQVPEDTKGVLGSSRAPNSARHAVGLSEPLLPPCLAVLRCAQRTPQEYKALFSQGDAL